MPQVHGKSTNQAQRGALRPGAHAVVERFEQGIQAAFVVERLRAVHADDQRPGAARLEQRRGRRVQPLHFLWWCAEQ